MRLIDADALIEGYKHMGYDPTEHPEESYMEGWCKGFNSATDHCIHHVIHAPTIEERKRGEWIPLGVRHGWICSKCRKENVYAFRSDDNGEYVLQDYFCPHCGADMRGGQDE